MVAVTRLETTAKVLWYKFVFGLHQLIWLESGFSFGRYSDEIVLGRMRG